MAGNPNINQGFLNRVRANLLFPNNPAYNITAPYLGKGGFNLTFSGAAAVYIDTLTGRVISQEPYLGVTIEAHLLRTQLFAETYKTLMENNGFLGPGTFRPDSNQLSVFNFTNVAIMEPGPLLTNGTDADWVFRFGGTYQINAALFNG